MGDISGLVQQGINRTRQSSKAESWRQMRQIEGSLAVAREQNKIKAREAENEMEKAKYERRAKALAGMLKGREAASKLSATLYSKGFKPEEIAQKIQPLLQSYAQMSFPDQDTTEYVTGIIKDVVGELPTGDLKSRAESQFGGKLPPGATVGTNAEGGVYISNAQPTKQYNAQQEEIIRSAQQGKQFTQDIAQRLGPGEGSVNPRIYVLKKYADKLVSPAGAGVAALFAGNNLTGEYKILDTALNNMRSLVSYLYSGKQINESERNALRAMLPTDTEIARGDRKAISYKLKGFYKMYTGILNRMQRGSEWNQQTGQYDLPEGEELPESFTDQPQTNVGQGTNKGFGQRTYNIGGITITQ